MSAEASHTGQELKPLRVAFETLGCRSNYADTVDLQALIVEHGGFPCGFDEAADVYVLNTCTITDSADREAWKLLRRVKRRFPAARVVVTGCLAEVGRESLEQTSLVDAVVSAGRKAEALEAILGETPRRLQTLGRNLRGAIALDAPLPAALAGPGIESGSVKARSRFHLRVQNGCDNSCTFCIVPRARGGSVSRASDDVLGDIERLAALGFNEIVLAGTHLGGYGEDCGATLFALLEQLAARSPVRRIRLSSIDPHELTPDLLRLLAESDAFCAHLHICFQAFSDRILKLMNRRYRLNQLRDALDLARQLLPAACIGGDVITGFPTESREECDEQLAVFEQLPISYLHVFPYSEREGTAATRLGPRVDLSERKRRAARWRTVGERRRAEFYRERVGEPLEIVAEEVTEEGVRGTSREYINASCRRPAREGEILTVQAVSFAECEGVMLCE